MKRSARLRTIATALAATFTLVNIAAAQTDREVVAAVYEASARVSSNIRGVNTFSPAPAGFNPLTASDMELATYGFPPRPNATTDSETLRAVGQGHESRQSALEWKSQRYGGV